jgi:transketolase
VGLGEDGPTHQPIEHLPALRAIPGLRLIRPADANECASAWRIAVEHDGPVGLVLTRQGIPVLDGTRDNDGFFQGAYALRDVDDPQLVLIGTGSEVAVCLDAADLLTDVRTRVVSMPCWDLFAEQPDDYRESVLPSGVPTLAVEAAATFGWERWADAAVGIDRFGASAPGAVALEKLGINPQNVADHARRLLAGTT